METRTEQKARTRRKLIDCALDLSAQKGFSALSLREVSQAAEITPAAFYRHFRDMEELGLTLVDEIALSLRRLLRNARKNSATADASTITLFSIETFIKYVNENSHLFRLLLGERSGSSDTFRKAIRHEIEIFVVELTEDLERIASVRKEKLRNSAFAAEAIVSVVFTVGAEVLDLPKNKQGNLKTRLVEEVNMILRGSKIYSKK
jgi:AcrR family transcriptional regulator